MADEGAEKKVRKEREPITFTCVVILLVACIFTTSSYAYGELFSSGDSMVVTESSTVSTDYTLSFYNYYDQGGVIYQTTMSNVNAQQKENSAYIFCDNYTFSNSRYSVKMSESDVLSGFKNALLGHKVGDTVAVAIKASEGYTNPVNCDTLNSLKGLHMGINVEMTYDDFNTEYGFTPTGNCKLGADDTGYGCTAEVIKNNDHMLMIHYNFEVGKDYKRTVDGINVTLLVTEVTDSDMTYNVILPKGGIDTTVIGDDGEPTSTFKYNVGTQARDTEYTATKMLEITLGTDTVYIIGHDAYGHYLYKRTTNETYGADLYFTIKIISIS